MLYKESNKGNSHVVPLLEKLYWHPAREYLSCNLILARKSELVYCSLRIFSKYFFKLPASDR